MNLNDKEITLVVDGKEIAGFAIVPKRNCKHLNENILVSLNQFFSDRKDIIILNTCENCQDQTENWICLDCSKIFCARSVKAHMLDHNHESKHYIALSFSDGSFWCYGCDSYIISPELEIMQRRFSEIKFPNPIPLKKLEIEKSKENSQSLLEEKKLEEKPTDKKKSEDNPVEEKKFEETPEKIEKLLGELSLSEIEFTRETFLQGIKTKKYKNIVFLTGAGISVSAGIPDFRTPGTGLYSKLQEYNLPYPEAVFELSYFKKNPHAFYTLSKGFLTAEIHPTTSHFFQKMLYDLGIINQIFTQNIDSLELDVGVPKEKLCQAHGHMRSCHCIRCNKEHDPKKMMESIENHTIYKCQIKNCNGLIKPDIIFFGEKLPADFFKKSFLLEKADLVIVMGTSLVVYPFANLLSLINKNIPIVLINREDSYSKGEKHDNYLFIGGDLDENVEIIVKELKMEEIYENIKKETQEKKLN